MNEASVSEARGVFSIEKVKLGEQLLRVGIRRVPNDHPPLLILNGIGANIELLTPFAEAWPEVSLLTFDAPGTGESPTPLWPYRLSGLSDLAVRLLDHYGYRRADVMGISWGGALAQQLARRHPGYCRRLVLCCTSAGAFMVPGRLEALLHMVHPRRYTDRDYMAQHACELYGGKFCDPDNKAARGHARRIKPPSGLGYYWQMLGALGWTSIYWLHRLEMEVMVMAGRDDPIVPLVNARILHRAIPNSVLKVYDCGHLFMLTCLDETVADLKWFLRQS